MSIGNAPILHPDQANPPGEYPLGMALGWNMPATAVQHMQVWDRLNGIPNPVQAFISTRRPQATQT